MIATSAQYKTIVAQGGYPWHIRGEMHLVDATVIELTNPDFMQNEPFTYQHGISRKGKFDYGLFPMKELTLTLNNSDGTFDGYDLNGAVLYLEVGLELPPVPPATENTIEWLDYGKFTVDAPVQMGIQIRLDCVDDVYRFMTPYRESTLVYPATLKEIVVDACSECGVIYNNDTFPNETVEVQAPPEDEALTFRDVMRMVGQLSSPFMYINASGELKFGEYGTTEMNITYITEYTKALNDFVVSGIEYNGTLYGTDEGVVLLIENNLLLDQWNSSTALTDLASRLVGFTFMPFDLTTYTDFSVECGQKVRIFLPNGEEHVSYITNLTHSIFGHSKYSGDAESELTNKASGFTEYAKTKAIAAAQADLKMTAYEDSVMEANEVLNNARGFYETRITDSTGRVIEYYQHDAALLEASTRVTKVTSAGIGFSTDGGDTYTTVITGSGLSVPELAARLVYADLMVAGTVDANVVDVVNLSATNIVSGTVDVERLNINLQGVNYLVNSVFDLEQTADYATPNVPSGTFDFTDGMADYHQRGWMLAYNALDVPWFIDGWVYNTISAQQTTYHGFNMLSNGIKIVPGEVYTLSITDGWIGDLSGIEIYVVAPATDTCTSADVYQVMGDGGGAEIVTGDDEYQKRFAYGQAVEGLMLPVRVDDGSGVSYEWEWQEKALFTPSINSVTFTLPDIIYNDTVYVFIKDVQTASTGKVLISQAQFERGRLPTAWKPNSQEYQSNNVTIIGDRADFTEVPLNINRKADSSLAELGLVWNDTTFNSQTGYTRSEVGSLKYDYVNNLFKLDGSIAPATASVYDLGSGSLPWNAGYFRTLNINNGTGTAIDVNNGSIVNVNRITINDPGKGEGIEWLGGNGWMIFESPDNFSGNTGNLQFASGGIDNPTFMARLTNYGTLMLAGHLYVSGYDNLRFSNSGTYFYMMDTASGGTSSIRFNPTGDGTIWTSGSMRAYQGLVIGDTGDSTSDTKEIRIISNGYAGIRIHGDYSNTTGEPGGSFIKFAVDGPSDNSIIGHVNTAGTAPDGSEYIGTVGNSMLIGTLNVNSLRFGIDRNVSALLDSTGLFTLLGKLKVGDADINAIKNSSTNWQMVFNSSSYIYIRDGSNSSTIRMYPDSGNLYCAGTVYEQGSTLSSRYAASSHTHAYAPASHTHSQYSTTSHTHSSFDYVTFSGIRATSNGVGTVGTSAVRFSAMYASTFSQTSDRSTKELISDISSADAYSKVLGMKVHNYTQKASQYKQIGLIVDEAPTEILDDDGKGIDLYSYISLVTSALQEAQKKIEALEDRLYGTAK